MIHEHIWFVNTETPPCMMIMSLIAVHIRFEIDFDDVDLIILHKKIMW